MPSSCMYELQSGAGQEMGCACGRRRVHHSDMLVLQRTAMQGTARQARCPEWHPKQYLVGEGLPIGAGPGHGSSPVGAPSRAGWGCTA